MNAAAPSGDGMRTLRTAAALCLASPVAACVVLPDGRLHVCNDLYRALFGDQPPPHTATLSLIPIREDETNVASGTLILVPDLQLDALRYTLSHDFLSPLRTMQEMARILEREHAQ